MFDRIISLENLFAAWKEFRKGKGGKPDVQAFEWRLEDEIFRLHEDLRDGTYEHGPYESFFVCDPKRRHIHKPSVRDRLVHHAVVRVVEPLFDRRFIFDAWSCRKSKGTHAAVNRLQSFCWRLSRNNTRTVWVLKLDIRKFFENVDQDVLLRVLSKTIGDPRVNDLFTRIIRSFSNGIPLGNLTSQLFANVYLNELDQLMKHEIRMRSYIRYCDDFVLTHQDREILESALLRIRLFLLAQLRLTLHPKKIILVPYHRGVDFLGFICFPHYRVLRAKTKRRMLRRVNEKNLASYNGILQHCRSHKLGIELLRIVSTKDQKLILTSSKPDSLHYELHFLSSKFRCCISSCV
ncbi:MAG: reverse transcriptase domain-containing protein [Patescibacteria group bacterium]